LYLLGTNPFDGGAFFLPLVAVAVAVVVFFVLCLAVFCLGRLGFFLAVWPAR
jgi:hypothetical protein|tara:strand:- start:48 stop:203 length:156 start_codon:yes stop_codon:yes gene_type:complete